jgi:hypothetical protein
MFKRNIPSLASELKRTPCIQQAEQASHGKRGSDMDRKRAQRESVEARRVMLALKRSIFAKVERWNKAGGNLHQSPQWRL